MADSKLIALVLALSFMGTEVAAAAPAQLLNKTVVASWGHDVSEKRPDGTLNNIHRTDTRQIYVSTARRLFVRSIGQVGRRQGTHDFAPADNRTAEGPRDAHFEGSRLVLTHVRTRGAGRLTIDFDPGFTSCTIKIIIGKEGGAPVIWRGVDGVTYELVSDTVTSSSCEIKDGNLFAGQ